MEDSHFFVCVMLLSKSRKIDLKNEREGILCDHWYPETKMSCLDAVTMIISNSLSWAIALRNHAVLVGFFLGRPVPADPCRKAVPNRCQKPGLGLPAFKIVFYLMQLVLFFLTNTAQTDTTTVLHLQRISFSPGHSFLPVWVYPQNKNKIKTKQKQN